jgi:hypothetical protein
MRVVDMNDGLPKWSGHRNESALLASAGTI